MGSFLAALGALPARVLTAVTAVLLVIVAALVVLYVATPIGERPNPWQIIGGAGVTLGVSVPSIAAWLKANVLHGQVQAQTSTMQRVEAQTNGVLDARIATQVRAALDDYFPQLTPQAPAAPAPTIPVQPAPPVPTPTPQEATP